MKFRCATPKSIILISQVYVKGEIRKIYSLKNISAIVN